MGWVVVFVEIGYSSVDVGGAPGLQVGGNGGKFFPHCEQPETSSLPARPKAGRVASAMPEVAPRDQDLLRFALSAGRSIAAFWIHS